MTMLRNNLVFDLKKYSQKLLLAVLTSVSVFGCVPQPADSHHSHISNRRIPETKTQKLLRELNRFAGDSSAAADSNLPQLQDRMDKFIHELDGLALQENLDLAEEILKKMSEAYSAALINAKAHPHEEYKEIWLHWSERLLLTRSSLQHFFSELQLNIFEKLLDTRTVADALAHVPALRSVLHPEHEARLISIYRAHSGISDAAPAILNLIAESGGPLARLFIFQRFKASPSLEFAEAMAKAGLPRTTDLLGDNSLTGNGPFYQLPRQEFTGLGRVMDSVRDFPDRWEEMKTYLESLKTIPDRLRKAREFWIEMHSAVETALDKLEVSEEKRTELKSLILQSYKSDRPPEALTYRRDGIEFREGDIVLVQAGETGGLWETFTHAGSLLSHLMMVTFDENGLPYSIEINFGQILLSPLDLKAERFVVVRAKNNTELFRQRIHAAFNRLLQKSITYDFQFDSDEHSKLYCAELAAAVLQEAEAGFQPFAFSPKSAAAAELLRKSGIRSTSFFAQGSYLASTHFDFVGERIYADPSALIRGQMILAEFKKHVGNSYAVRAWHHPDSPTVFGLSVMAQTLGAELKRGLGPQPFLYTVMILDRLVRAVDDDARKASFSFQSGRPRTTSRIIQFKGAISDALKSSVPQHLSSVFPHSKD
ncbi:MAG: hypothetical protein EBR09_00190 [Proteobacteria bacterium]|nr:hypothetical protein [Pseudomonadota bacterium]